MLSVFGNLFSNTLHEGYGQGIRVGTKTTTKTKQDITAAFNTTANKTWQTYRSKDFCELRFTL